MLKITSNALTPKPMKLVISNACYDKQQVCLSATVFLLDWSTVAEITNLVPSNGRLLELRVSKLTLLKSMFNAENFICRLSWSIISTDFGAVHS